MSSTGTVNLKMDFNIRVRVAIKQKANSINEK